MATPTMSPVKACPAANIKNDPVETPVWEIPKAKMPSAFGVTEVGPEGTFVVFDDSTPVVGSVVVVVVDVTLASVSDVATNTPAYVPTRLPSLP